MTINMPLDCIVGSLPSKAIETMAVSDPLPGGVCSLLFSFIVIIWEMLLDKITVCVAFHVPSRFKRPTKVGWSEFLSESCLLLTSNLSTSAMNNFINQV
jgi:hypothetical protein